MIVEDGHGTGNTMKVVDGYALVEAKDIPFEQYINENGDAYKAIVSNTPTGAADCFLYIKNNDSKNMYVSSITLNAATDETIQIKVKDVGTPAGTSANTLVNKNAGSGNLADVTCYEGVNITALSGGSVVEQVSVYGATGSRTFTFNSKIIVPKNTVLSLYAVTGAIAISVSLDIVFK